MSLRADRMGRAISAGCRIEALEPRQLFNSITVNLDAPEGKSRRVLFKGPVGSPSYIQAFDCGVNITFEGDNLQQSSTTEGVPTIEGNITRISSFDVLGSNSSAVHPTVTLFSGEDIPVNDVNDTVALKAFNMPNADLQDGTFTGALSIFNVHSISNETMGLNGIQLFPKKSNLGPIKLSVAKDATNFHITSTVPLQSFTVGGNAAAEPGTLPTAGSASVTAPAASTVKIGGSDIGVDFNFTGSGSTVPLPFKVFQVKGDMNGGSLGITGDAPSIQAKSLNDIHIDVTNILKIMKSSGDVSGSTISAGEIGTLDVGGSLTNSIVNAQDGFSAKVFDIKSVDVGNTILDSSLIAPGSIDRIIADAISGSKIEAGMSSSFNYSSPVSTSDFLNEAEIDSILLRRSASSDFNFVDGQIAADKIGTANIGRINPDNGGRSFGFDAVTIGKISAGLANKTINLKKIHSAADLSAQLSAAGVTPQQQLDMLFDLLDGH